ncbi:unnamed protein product [Cylicocyclus nassatus]|uniref:Uncharacterized protein n=1 Tax=Cylicocyclus nassatus TaxID=53992 RepID=A0AA36MIH7_CYLNA|nr:unnamed protein product [Cylicocyclus nassatus]
MQGDPVTSARRRCAGGGNEVVIVVEDTPKRIVLQHLLLDEKSGHITKHWRQDWVYEAPNRFEFSADQTWQVRTIPAATNQGAWTQCVYEVSDAPRYCGTGKWTYSNNVPSWTSDLSWRPLPRREYTKRSDYNALAVINRHTLTPERLDPRAVQHQGAAQCRWQPGGDRARVRLQRLREDHRDRLHPGPQLLEGHRWLLGQGAPALGRLPDPGPGRAPEDQDRRHGDDHPAVHPRPKRSRAGKKVKDKQIDEVFAKYVEKAPKEG